VVRGTFSPSGRWRPAVVARLARTLGGVNTFIDESGSFAWHPRRGSWCVVAAVTAPESARRDIASILRRLRASHGVHKSEVKLPQLGEGGYIRFLDELAKVDVALFATATDSGLNAPNLVAAHRTAQAAAIRVNVPRMRYEGGRRGVQLLADEIDSLPNQLYVQLVCQVGLLDDVVRRAINFWVQRRPATLREFRWRVDQKNTTKTTFESAFEKIAPALLQTRSIQEPAIQVRGFDYRHFSAYEFADGEFPEYLQAEHGLPAMDGFNLQKLIRGNLSFADSKAHDGLQIADLLASGLRRAMKLAFDDPQGVAERLGRLTVQNVRDRQSISLVSLGPEEALPPPQAAIVKTLSKYSKPFIAANAGRNAA